VRVYGLMLVMSVYADAPPAYTSPVGYPVMPQQHQQPSAYHGGDAPLPTKA